MQSENNEHEQESMAQQTGHYEPILSDTWRELLGLSDETTASIDAQASYSRDNTGGQPETGPASGAEIPMLTNDPWAELQHEQGIEIVDLQQLHAQLNDRDLEQALQFMQEQPTPGNQEK